MRVIVEFWVTDTKRKEVENNTLASANETLLVAGLSPIDIRIERITIRNDNHHVTCLSRNGDGCSCAVSVLS